MISYSISSKRRNSTMIMISCKKIRDSVKFTWREWLIKWKLSWKNKKKFSKTWRSEKSNKNSRTTSWQTNKNQPLLKRENQTKWKMIWFSMDLKPFWGIEKSNKEWVPHRCLQNLIDIKTMISATRMIVKSRWKSLWMRKMMKMRGIDIIWFSNSIFIFKQLISKFQVSNKKSFN